MHDQRSPDKTGDLDAIETRAKAALPGPWSWREVVGHGNFVQLAEHPTGYIGFYTQPLDADFIAHARTDVPALVARVRELEAALATEVKIIEDLIDAIDGFAAGEIDEDALISRADKARPINRAAEADDARRALTQEWGMTMTLHPEAEREAICPACSGAGSKAAAISGETRGPAEDARRIREAIDNPVRCYACRGTGRVTTPPDSPRVGDGDAREPASSELNALIEKATARGPMTDEELAAQRDSFVKAEMAMNCPHANEDCLPECKKPEGGSGCARKAAEDAREFVMVPREPTEAMLRNVDLVGWNIRAHASEIWRAMLAASPPYLDNSEIIRQCELSGELHLVGRNEPTCDICDGDCHAPVGSVLEFANHASRELAKLRAALAEATASPPPPPEATIRGKALEEAARWHDAQYAEARTAAEGCKMTRDMPGMMAANREGNFHKNAARSIRSLIGTAPQKEEA